MSHQDDIVPLGQKRPLTVGYLISYLFLLSLFRKQDQIADYLFLVFPNTKQEEKVMYFLRFEGNMIKLLGHLKSGAWNFGSLKGEHEILFSQGGA